MPQESQVTGAEGLITEEELHAFVDGLLDPERRVAVERHLREYHDVAQRVAVDRDQREKLKAAFAARAAEPIPPSLDLAKLVGARRVRRRAAWRIAAAMLLAFWSGGAGGWLLHAGLAGRSASGIDALAREAVASHLVYSSDQRRPVELGAAQREDLERWVSRRLNRPVAPPDLTAVGYRFMGGRLVATERGPAGLFVYDNEQDHRLTIFVRPMTAGQASPITLIDIGDVDGCAWVTNGVGYTLIAAQPYAELLRLSEYARRKIETPV
jgi:anti-sigma factor RsiW